MYANGTPVIGKLFNTSLAISQDVPFFDVEGNPYIFGGTDRLVFRSITINNRANAKTIILIDGDVGSFIGAASFGGAGNFNFAPLERGGFPFIPGFSGQSRVVANGGGVAGGVDIVIEADVVHA